MYVYAIHRMKFLLRFFMFMSLQLTQIINAQNFVYLDVQNDFLNYKGQGTDKYFTGGISSGGLLHLDKSQDHYIVISINQKMYTPSNISLYPEELNPIDYPYAGLTYLNTGYLVFDKHNNAYTKGVFSWGTTGSSSGAKLIQQKLHKLIDDRTPNGWSTQVDLGNFMQIHLEHTRSLHNQGLFKINSTTQLALGSIFNNLSVAIEFKLDRTKDPFISFFSKRLNSNVGFDICLWTKPKLTYVMGNRLLETNQYPTGMNARIINRIIYQSTVGISFQVKNWNISLIQHHNTPEFKTATPHAYGEIAIQLNI